MSDPHAAHGAGSRAAMPNPDTILSREECRRRREASGLSLPDLGRRAKMSAASLRRFEYGTLKFNGPTWRLTIRKALETAEALPHAPEVGR